MGLFSFVKSVTIHNSFSYNKQEKLKSRKTIDHLFNKGKSFFIFPLKLLYSLNEEAGQTLQAGVTCSKRNFKKAVYRNRVKRVVREAYRLNKMPLQQLLTEQHLSLSIFFIYTGKELPDFKEVETKMKLLLNKLVDNLTKNQEN